MPWINHPASQNGPVSIWRWTAYHVAGWLVRLGRRLEDYSLDHRYDEIPF